MEIIAKGNLKYNIKIKNIFLFIFEYFKRGKVMDLLNGVVEQALTGKEGGEPYGFIIRGTDYKTYYAHLGDLKKNEKKLYKNLNRPTAFLKEGDHVEFNCYIPSVHLLAIHVDKKDRN
jgi:hypothetical protein